MEDKLIIVGNINGKPLSSMFSGTVYSEGGISPTIAARDYKEPKLVMIEAKKTLGQCIEDVKTIIEADRGAGSD